MKNYCFVWTYFVCFRYANFMACELCLNKAVIKKQVKNKKEVPFDTHFYRHTMCQGYKDD